MTSRPSILITAAAGFAVCAVGFANFAVAEDASKAAAMTADHMSSDHMAPMKKPKMKKHMMKEGSMMSDHMAPDAPK
jgi:pentapeptide MXKDX repeat protein